MVRQTRRRGDHRGEPDRFEVGGRDDSPRSGHGLDLDRFRFGCVGLFRASRDRDGSHLLLRAAHLAGRHVAAGHSGHGEGGIQLVGHVGVDSTSIPSEPGISSSPDIPSAGGISATPAPDIDCRLERVLLPSEFVGEFFLLGISAP